MTDLSTANLGLSGAQVDANKRGVSVLSGVDSGADQQISAQSMCNFESAIKLAAEFFNQQQQHFNQQHLFNPYLQQQQQQQQQANRQSVTPSSPSSNQASSHMLNPPLQDLTARHPILSRSNGIDLANQLAFLQQQQQHNQRDSNAAALHVHLLLQSQVS